MNYARERGLQSYDEYEHKKALYKCLMSVNILEGVRFYVSLHVVGHLQNLKRWKVMLKLSN